LRDHLHSAQSRTVTQKSKLFHIHQARGKPNPQSSLRTKERGLGVRFRSEFSASDAKITFTRERRGCVSQAVSRAIGTPSARRGARRGSTRRGLPAFLDRSSEAYFFIAVRSC